MNEEMIYPLTDREQGLLNRLKRTAVVTAAGGSLFILGLFDYLYGLWNSFWLETWNNHIEGYVPLIALAPEG
jgi:hypothetical protein